MSGGDTLVISDEFDFLGGIDSIKGSGEDDVYQDKGQTDFHEESIDEVGSWSEVNDNSSGDRRVFGFLGLGEDNHQP